ncbi:ERT1 (YBR239C) [Zygosaccharomyces parabailii]|uniref:ZYBA0S03-05028g1_1 n=1 Tax=Zygosaccharomyces bailii (strain CLIB 213 / ATCC 58445 / CBS 680 / BCRC 21525 / NBRC 1098 / NCYC 1416 / NRRL Y-2227) TaxID=1333698 RepID=A0A8J2T633_ZYGB2|nr:ERT1 (YBR239C) [Zygosaccharomyces parabailii]CDF88922.1 ZYBA0S03-05028g1_1 [Zygosaccharomyces bailii CLIB 213]SJM83014.1 probable Transcription activator of gluconeogenesis [Zygosaccharomyces bailii]
MAMKPGDELDNRLSQRSQVASPSPGTRRKPRRNTHIACVNCSKWHVSCEPKRPCHRCVLKGLESTCVDAPRKKSKYLAGVPDASLMRSVHGPNYSSSSPTPDSKGYAQSHDHEQQSFTDPHHIVHKSKFLSNAADSEYSILSDIINQDTFLNKLPLDMLNAENPRNATTKPIGSATVPRPPSSSLYSMLLGPNSQEIIGSRVDLFANHFPLTPVDSPNYTLPFKSSPSRDANFELKSNALINQYYLNSETAMLPEVIDMPMGTQPREGCHLSFALESLSPDAAQISSNPAWDHSLRYSTSMEIYRLINEPFSHTPGFHHLYTYLRQRFSREDLLEMCGCLAEFRPIFIACTATLTEEDMIFMEQCYQRTLLEYAKFIVQIGTPTCVWRRNGQISYVNEEFEILSGWHKEELLNKMTFIVEIMDDESVNDYFKTFAKVAYKDFKGSEKMQCCNLLTPARGQVIRCCCIWTLKRDVSGLPLMILGNFMPILNN